MDMDRESIELGPDSGLEARAGSRWYGICPKSEEPERGDYEQNWIGIWK